MKYLKYIWLAAGLAVGTFSSRAEVLPKNPLSIKSFAVTPGESLSLVMYYDTPETYIGAQFEIHLPEGISFAMNPKKPTTLAKATVNGELTETHSISANLLPDGTYRAVLISLENEDLLSGDWIVKIPIVVSADYKGSAQGSLFSCRFSTHEREDRYDETEYFDVYVEPTAIRLSESTVKLITGESISLTATYEPESAAEMPLKWTSSDPTIATVDNNGGVTGVAHGNCTIKAELAGNPQISAT